MPNISPKAIVERGAKIAADAVVGPFSYIGPQVRIGAGCVIGNNATITGATTLGDRTRVFPLAVVGAAPEGGEAGECFIGKGNTIREQVTIFAGGPVPTTIGTANLIMISCVVGAGATIGDHGIIVNCTIIGPGAKLEDYIHTSAFAVVGPGVKVGSYSFIAGYADVDRDAPPYAFLQGSPFRVRGVNTEGLKRSGFGEQDIRALKDAFREIFNGEGSTPDAAAVARLLESPDPCIRRLVGAVVGRPAEASPPDLPAQSGADKRRSR